MTFEFKPGCEFCDKRGLPVLVSRYATAPAAAGAPHVDLVDADHKTPLSAPGGGLHYTRRLLRTGYLYVFDEKRNYWEAYFVTNDAYLMRFPPHACMATAYTPDLQPCSQTGHPEVAGMVTIVDPKNAGNVWFGFSDVEWTPAVLAAHADAGYRAKHMQKVDIQKALAHASQPYVYPLKKLGETIAEYACDPLKATAPNAFYESPFPFNPRRLQLEQTLRAADYLRKDAGIVVGLFDPAGVAIELSALMSQRMKAFTARPKYAHPLPISSTILSLEKAVRRQAELDEIKAAHENAREMLVGGNTGLPTGGGAFAYVASSSYRKMVDEVDTVTPAQLQKASDQAWGKYATKYRETTRRKFQEDFDKDFEKFDKERIAPLAQAHVSWMRSQHMAHHFECQHDPADIDSGAAYTTRLSACIGSTQDKKACFDLYAEWLHGSLTDKTNILLRGMVLNQDELAKLIAAGAANATDPKTLPWDGMIGAFAKAVAHRLEGHPDIFGRLMTQMLGPLGKVAKEFAEVGALPHALVAMGVITKSPVLRIPVTGRQEDFIRIIVQELLRLRGQASGQYGLTVAVEREVERLQIRGERLQGTREKRFLIAVDLDALRGVAPATPGQQRAYARALSGALLHVDDVEALELHRWRGFLARGGTITKTGLPFAFGAVAALLQMVAISSLSDSLEKAKQSGDGVLDAEGRYYGMLAVLVGNVAELLGSAMEKVPASRFTLLRYGRQFGRVFGLLGKALGVFGAVITGLCDGKKGLEAFDKGQQGLAIAYFASSALGMGGAFLMLSEAAFVSGVGIILVLIAIGLSFLIDYIRDNPLQEWLAAGYFGENTFNDAAAELGKLKAITQ